MFENPRRGRQARNSTTNVPKILDHKSSSEQIFFGKLSLGAPDLRGFSFLSHVQPDLNFCWAKPLYWKQKLHCCFLYSSPLESYKKHPACFHTLGEKMQVNVLYNYQQKTQIVRKSRPQTCQVCTTLLWVLLFHDLSHALMSWQLISHKFKHQKKL